MNGAKISELKDAGFTVQEKKTCINISKDGKQVTVFPRKNGYNVVERIDSFDEVRQIFEQSPPQQHTVIESSAASFPVTEADSKLIPEEFIYIARSLETGNTDVDEFFHSMKQGHNVLLQGPTGGGKTALARFYCSTEKRPYKRISMNGGVTVEDLIGHYILKEGNSPWIDGLLTRAVREGWVLVVDEINAASPEVLFVLNSLLDDERILILSSKDGEVITPHPDFRLIATMNPAEEGYAGTHEMNQALMDRFHMIMYIDYDTDIEYKILRQMDIEVQEARNIIEFSKRIRTAYNNGELYTPWSTRSIINFAELRSCGREKMIINRFRMGERTKVRDILRDYFEKVVPTDSNTDKTEF